jgi:hypothetical protein
VKNLVLAQGALAYYDSFNGLIPCRVLSVRRTAKAKHGNIGETTVLFRITAQRPGYQIGEVLESIGTHVVPRGVIRSHNHQIRIQSYTYEETV